MYKVQASSPNGLLSVLQPALLALSLLLLHSKAPLSLSLLSTKKSALSFLNVQQPHSNWTEMQSCCSTQNPCSLHTTSVHEAVHYVVMVSGTCNVVRYAFELEGGAHGADHYTAYTECERTAQIWIYHGHRSQPASVGLAQACPNFWWGEFTCNINDIMSTKTQTLYLTEPLT